MSDLTSPTSTPCKPKSLLLAAGPDLLAGLLLTAGLAWGVTELTSLPMRVVAQSLAVFGVMAALICLGLVRGAAPLCRCSLGLANRVTLVRAAIVALFAGLVFHIDALTAQQAWVLVALAAFCLVLDGVDGWVARRLNTSSDFGARFDMELDAFFILVLCALVLELGKAGPWVLLIGLLRYVFVAASWWLPALRARLPDSLRRKTVCVVQGIVLVASLVPIMHPLLVTVALVAAFVLLTYSFAVDSLWLMRHDVGRGNQSASP